MIESFFRQTGTGIFLLACLSVLSCCNLHRLTVQTQYLTSENLASFYMNTPDPALTQCVEGQRLLIQWCLPNDSIIGKKLFLHVKIRLRNRRELEQITPLRIRGGKYTRGFYPYDLTGTDYDESGGILTYKIEILSGDTVIESWEHPLWANLIVFPEARSPAASTE